MWVNVKASLSFVITEVFLQKSLPPFIQFVIFLPLLYLLQASIFISLKLAITHHRTSKNQMKSKPKINQNLDEVK